MGQQHYFNFLKDSLENCHKSFGKRRHLRQSLGITALIFLLSLSSNITGFGQMLQNDPMVNQALYQDAYQNNNQTQNYYTPNNSNEAADENPYLIDFPQPTLPDERFDSGSLGSEGKAMQLSVVKTRVLPSAMYGQWSVTATLQETNLPNGMTPLVHDIWNLYADGDAVYISNPTTGAETNINVDQVMGNTATFHHRVVLKPNRRVLIERPTVTVNGDVLFGKTKHTFLSIKNGEVVKRYFALFQINAERLGENPTRYEKVNADDLEFEIADVQDETNPEQIDNDYTDEKVEDATTVDSQLYDW